MRGFDLDSAGVLYVSDGLNDRIQVIAPDGTFLRSWGSPGLGDGQFQFPMDVAINAAGEVYVIDGVNHRIQKFDAVGNFLLKWGSRGTANGELESPRGIAIAEDGSVYVVECGGARVQVFTGTGDYVTKWGSAGTGNGQFQCPSGIAIDAQDRVYIADLVNDRIQVFDSQGAFLFKWGTSGGGDGQFGRPHCITISARQEVYVSDLFNHRIQKFTTEGLFVTKFGTLGSGIGQFSSPIEVAADHSTDNIYVADEDLNRMQRFSYIHVGVYGDSMGTTTDVVVPDEGPAVLYLRGTEALGATGAEFRIEVASPAGYFFSYSPPTGAQVFGSPMDLTPENPTDAAGISVIFSTCRPSSSQPLAPGRTDYGRVLVYRFGGGFSDLVVRPKVPLSDPGMPCARVFGCDSPFFTPLCMSPLSLGSDGVFIARLRPAAPDNPTDLQAMLQGVNPEVAVLMWNPPASESVTNYNVYRSVNTSQFTRINASPVLTTTYTDSALVSGTLCYRVAAVDSFGQEGGQSESACVFGVPPFADEILYLDTREPANDGMAGPVTTSQTLTLDRDYLITVQGSFSLWPASAWASPPNLLCGTPERDPVIPSPSAINGAVGVDCELIFAVPLPPGGNCDALPSLGYSRHPSKFMIDLGTSFAHIEPIGGEPQNSAPGHRYQYLVRGQGSPARFAWIDNATNDNYGVLMIAVRRVSPTDVAPWGLRDGDLSVRVISPVRSQAVVQYSLSQSSVASLTIFDVRGQMIRQLVAGPQSRGVHSVPWNGRDDRGASVGSGVYYVRLQTLWGSASDRLTLIR